jgi:mRNA-degrading endonuclease toxin of MazEF toxin-antitoxin module
MSAQKWNLSPGHIIRAEVPHTDSRASDDRYPVVVSSADYNQKYPYVIVAFTTSSTNIEHPFAFDVEISERHPDFGLTGLPHSTTVRCGRLHTINKKKIYDVLGVVPDDLLLDIQRLIIECFNGNQAKRNKK